MCWFSFIYNYREEKFYFGQNYNSHTEIKNALSQEQLATSVDIEWPENGPLLIRATTFDEREVTLKAIKKYWPTRGDLVEYIKQRILTYWEQNFTILQNHQESNLYQFLTAQLQNDAFPVEILLKSLQFLKTYYYAMINILIYNLNISAEEIRKYSSNAAFIFSRCIENQGGITIAEYLLTKEELIKCALDANVNTYFAVVTQANSLTREDCLMFVKKVKGTSYERQLRSYLSLSMIDSV